MNLQFKNLADLEEQEELKKPLPIPEKELHSLIADIIPPPGPINSGQQYPAPSESIPKPM